MAPQNPEMLGEKRMNLIEARLAEVVKDGMLRGFTPGGTAADVGTTLYREV